MLKRILIVLAISLSLVVAAVPMRTVKAILMTPDEVAMLDANSLDDSSDSAVTKKKKENGFARAVKAPFKAIGRLFGIGRKDNNRISRMREGDAKKFESVGLTRVVDARVVPPDQTTTKPAAEKPAIDAATISDEDARKISAREHLEYGRQLLNGGDLNGAIAALSTAITLNPKLKDAHNLMGVAYESKGLRNIAFKSFEMALKGGDDDPEHLNNLGYLYYKNGELDNALKYLKRAVKKAPANQRYWNNLGLVQARMLNFDDAYESFARANGQFQGHMNVAARLQLQGMYTAAIKHLEQARALRPKSTDILERLVALYDRTGRSNDALEARNSITTLRAVATQ